MIEIDDSYLVRGRHRVYGPPTTSLPPYSIDDVEYMHHSNEAVPPGIILSYTVAANVKMGKVELATLIRKMLILQLEQTLLAPSPSPLPMSEFNKLL